MDVQKSSDLNSRYSFLRMTYQKLLFRGWYCYYYVATWLSQISVHPVMKDFMEYSSSAVSDIIFTCNIYNYN